MTRSLALAAVLALAPAALAQNAFRPLPELPEFGEWPGAASPSIAAARAATRFHELDAATDLPQRRTFVEVRALADVSAGADFDGGGSLSTQRGGWEATIGTELDEERIAALSIATEAYFYNLSGANTLVPGENEPFNDMYRASVSGLVRSSADGGPGWFGGFHLELAGEDEAAADRSLVVGGLGGVRYRAGDALDLELGVATLSRLEDDPWIWPYIGFRWRASEWLEFAARGTELEGRARIAERWSVLGRAEYVLRQFRLNSDNPLPSGVLRDEQIRAGVGLERRGDDGFAFEVLAGVNLWRELSTLDRDGAPVTESELDPAPFVALALSISL